MSELLSPAGDIDALRAAISGGADAVYLGLTEFSARAGAGNFDADALRTARTKCDRAGVKIYVTLNTLLFDRELPRLQEAVRLLCEVGVDGVIVQDLAVAEAVHRLAPSLPLHGSTQMTVHSLSGAKALEKMGFVRVVLARELSLDQIRHIVRNTTLETEVFVHGALCMCYSGHCYFSSVIGQKSGNRGRCAQPCRLPYGGGYPLSLKDLCALEHLDALRQMGVTSFKIEGRLKSPEYVALVTRAYAERLAGRTVSPELRKALTDIFSRDGFTDGYLTEQVGKAMFGTKQKTEFADYKSAVALAERQKPFKRFSLSVTLKAPIDAPSEWIFDDGHHTVTLTGPAAGRAATRPLTRESLFEKLDKLTDTPYVLRAVTLEGEDAFLPVSALNDMRKKGIEALDGMRHTAPIAFTEAAPAPLPAGSGKGGTELLFRSAQGFDRQADYSDFRRVWLPIPLLSLYEGDNRGAVIDHFCSDDELTGIMQTLQVQHITDVLVGNIGHIAPLKAAGFAVWGDYALNITNSQALARYAAMGLAGATLSFELSLPQIRDLQLSLPTALICYGRLPLMTFRNCAMKNLGFCRHHDGYGHLTDRKGETFLLECRADCGNTLYNAVPLFLEQSRLRDGITARLEFTDETPEQVRDIIHCFATGAKPARRTTRGLYLRGIL